MSGVTILNTMEHTRWAWGWTQWSWIALGVIVIALVTLWCITGYRRYLKGLGETMPKFFTWKRWCIFVALLGCVGLFLTCRFSAKEKYNTYQVLLDDSVSITEFRSAYEILEEQGITYVVQDRD